MTTDEARRLRAIANTPVTDLSYEQLWSALVALKADSRVRFVCYQLDTDDSDVPWVMFNIRAAFANDPLDGVHSVGRCLNAMLGPNEDVAAKTEAERVRRQALLDADKARSALMRRKDRNLARLTMAGISPETLARYVKTVISGSYIDPSDRAHADFAWYENNIVRGDGRSFELHRYLSCFEPG